MQTRNGRPEKHASSLGYLRCRAEPGMFRGELLVHIEGMDPRKPAEKIPIQLFVDRSEVAELNSEPRRNSPVGGWLRVTLVFKRGEIGEVILPQPAQPVGESMLVDMKDFREDVKV